jgi:hypothetical protein
MTEQQPQLTPEEQEQLNLTLLPAEQLSSAAILNFYQGMRPRSWQPTRDAWQAIEAGAADPSKEVDFNAVEQDFLKTINLHYMDEYAIRTTMSKPTALFPGGEPFLYTVLGLAYTPHFAAKHYEERSATAEENGYAFKVVGRALHYARNPRTFNSTSNAISQLMFHALFLDEGSPMQPLPASPRELAGPGKRGSHHAYGWEQDTHTKDPVRITYTGKSVSSRGAGVTLLRVGHKLHETAKRTELPHGYEPEERMRILRNTAALTVDRAKGYRLPAEDAAFLDRARDALYATMQRRAAERADRQQ